MPTLAHINVSSSHASVVEKTITSANSLNVLLVEDNFMALGIAEFLFAKAGCNFMSAASGVRALELVRMHNFDIILTDIGLPDISGD